ncbi:uncharacterized protein [Miscanthus floridulus]|uniref:uncharacterized protein n=1 Tax=Miscanthus floridulus TaxID=154761 RepID=UPI00345A69D5
MDTRQQQHHNGSAARSPHGARSVAYGPRAVAAAGGEGNGLLFLTSSSFSSVGSTSRSSPAWDAVGGGNRTARARSPPRSSRCSVPLSPRGRRVGCWLFGLSPQLLALTKLNSGAGARSRSTSSSRQITAGKALGDRFLASHHGHGHGHAFSYASGASAEGGMFSCGALDPSLAVHEPSHRRREVEFNCSNTASSTLGGGLLGAAVIGAAASTSSTAMTSRRRPATATST